MGMTKTPEVIHLQTPVPDGMSRDVCWNAWLRARAPWAASTTLEELVLGIPTQCPVAVGILRILAIIFVRPRVPVVKWVAMTAELIHEVSHAMMAHGPEELVKQRLSLDVKPVQSKDI